MEEGYINCPYCGEPIRAMAKKCRFCGEWLVDKESLAAIAPQSIGYKAPDQNPVDLNTLVNVDGSNIPVVQEVVPAPFDEAQPAVVQVNGPVQSAVQTPPTAAQQIIVQPQIVVENNIEQNVEVEQTVVVESDDDDSSGWLYFECLLVGIGVWVATGKFWWGVATFILLIIACAIPVIGHIVCIALGAALGLVIGAICAAFGASTWIAWLVGIVAGVGMIGVNLEGRK